MMTTFKPRIEQALDLLNQALAEELGIAVKSDELGLLYSDLVNARRMSSSYKDLMISNPRGGEIFITKRTTTLDF